MDMIRYIVFVIKNEINSENPLSEYTLEYSTALLMNLSLRSAGKDCCEDPELELLHVLNELFGKYESVQVRTYVNGTLYSIFKRKSLRDQAKELGMEEILQYLLQQSDDQLGKQIQYILQQLNEDDDQDEESTDEEEEEEEEDYDDDDVEDFDSEYFDDDQNFVRLMSGEPCGEEFLSINFIANTEDALNQTQTIQSRLQES